jgi:hypothetical protein
MMLKTAKAVLGQNVASAGRRDYVGCKTLSVT